MPDVSSGAKRRLRGVEFHNHRVKLAGSLLLPKSERLVPAIVFVHGAGPQTREQYRKQGEFFASQGIAALIYDKRGTGESGGAYATIATNATAIASVNAADSVICGLCHVFPYERLGAWNAVQVNDFKFLYGERHPVRASEQDEISLQEMRPG